MHRRARRAIVGVSSEESVMSITTGQEGEQTRSGLASELHQLEAKEAALERRTHSLELGGPLTLLLSVVALALSIAAFVIALSNDSNGTGGSLMPTAAGRTGMMAGNGTQGMMSGTKADGRFSAATIAQAANGKVYAQLGDYWVAPSVSTVRAGKVTFYATNVGKVPHELMVERMPIKFDSPMRPTEDAALGMIEDMDAGETGQMTVSLTPGTYMLFCNVTGHYAAGQHTVFRVTGS